MIWQTHLCPVAAIHDLLHGTEIRLGGRSLRGFSSRPTGERWHSYVAQLRLKISSQHLKLPKDTDHALQVIREDFERWVWAQQVPPADAAEIWKNLMEPYAAMRIKNGELFAIVGQKLLPEVTVGSTRVEVPLGKGARTYPIEARIDEINLSTGVLVERTSLPVDHAARYKDVQLAVIALILRSLPGAGIPEEWSAVRHVQHFVLETPTHTVMMEPTAQHYDAIHEAAAIIRDIAASELAEWPVYQLAQCTPVQPHPVCSHAFVNCFFSTPTYPLSRAAMKRETRMLCRAELYELLWQRDLIKYRLYNQIDSGPAYPGLPLEIIDTGEDAASGPFVEARVLGGNSPEIDQGILIVGTPFIGVRREVRAIDQNPSTETLRLYCDLRGLPLPRTGVLWPAVREGLLFEQAPDFLIRQRQRDLFTFRKIGSNDQLVAQQDGVLQLLEALFGGGSLET